MLYSVENVDCGLKGRLWWTELLTSIIYPVWYPCLLICKFAVSFIIEKYPSFLDLQLELWFFGLMQYEQNRQGASTQSGFKRPHSHCLSSCTFPITVRTVLGSCLPERHIRCSLQNLLGLKEDRPDLSCKPMSEINVYCCKCDTTMRKIIFPHRKEFVEIKMPPRREEKCT